ncbi:MAG: CRISPR system precrRNA processing endoribonuclease RAMP protein Cas6 [Chloroflexi bacterium]|nr:MAG: CRISPR system precrRNA processing endoribonuclease RAMP protein Cas6 [Chloroflexota bacterium]
MGDFTLTLEDPEPVWPMLWHGQFLHVGKCTSMGHGAYRLEHTSG